LRNHEDMNACIARSAHRHAWPSALLSLVPLVLITCGGSSSPSAPAAVSEPSQVVEPACPNPAPLEGAYDPRAPGYLVIFHDGVDAQATADELAAQYGFTVERVWTAALLGFSTPDATPEAVAGLRCEPTVKLVEHNGSVAAS